MAERKGRSQVTTVERDLYQIKFTSEEADTYFNEVLARYRAALVSPHGGKMNALRGNLSEENISNLTSGIGILLPLAHQDVVQRGETQAASMENIQFLLSDVCFFLSRFRNTGIKMVGEYTPHFTLEEHGQQSSI